MKLRATTVSELFEALNHFCPVGSWGSKTGLYQHGRFFCDLNSWSIWQRLLSDCLDWSFWFWKSVMPEFGSQLKYQVFAPGHERPAARSCLGRMVSGGWLSTPKLCKLSWTDRDWLLTCVLLVRQEESDEDLLEEAKQSDGLTGRMRSQVSLAMCKHSELGLNWDLQRWRRRFSAWPDEIVLSTLTEGQKSRSARLFALLNGAFSTHGRVDSLIRAYEAGCPIHNSPAKPFGSCGYELLRILAKEFSLKTRTEAICLRSELLRKEFKVDSKVTHMISDLIRMIQVAINKYNQLIETLPRDVSKLELQVTSADLALMFIRNLPHEAKQYCLLHSQDETFESLHSAGLKFERQQRLYVELGTMSKRFVNEIGEYDGFEEGQGSETVDAVQTGCSRCGKKFHDAKSCTTDLSKLKCFKWTDRSYWT